MMDFCLKEENAILANFVAQFFGSFGIALASLLELVDAVRARHVTPEIPVYYTVVAEP